MPALVFLLLGTSIAGAQTASDETILISRQSAADGGAAGDSFSLFPSVSKDGRYVAFQSQSHNLSPAAQNVDNSIFVRDVRTSTTTLASGQSAAATVGALDPSISANGRYVAYEALVDDPSGAGQHAIFEVFVRDMRTNTTRLASRQSAAAGGVAAIGDSLEPSISADGRYVAFSSGANNLSRSDDNAFYNIFVRDTRTNTTKLVSRRSAADGGARATASSLGPSISGNGRFIAFSSHANNLSAADDNAVKNIFVRDTRTNTTRLVSRRSAADGGAGANDNSSGPSISADGRHVAFRSRANNLSRSDDNRFSNIFVRDTRTNTTTLTSRQSAVDGGAGANSDSFGSSITADGRQVAFGSVADNLSPSDNNAFPNVFVRNTKTNTTTLVNLEGAGGSPGLTGTAIAADGHHVAFTSFADYPGAIDSNLLPQVFLRTINTGTR